jgi:hypothetical protein
MEHADELFRVIVGQRLEDDRVHHREDRRVRANAERQRQQGDQSKARRTGEAAQAVAENSVALVQNLCGSVAISAGRWPIARRRNCRL